MQMPTMQAMQPPKVKPGEKLEAWLQRSVPALVSGFGKSQDVATQLATQAWMQVNQSQPDAQMDDGWGGDGEGDGFGDSGGFGGFGKSMWSDDDEEQGFEWDDPQDEWGQPVSDIANGAEPEIDSTIAGNPAEWFQKRLGEYAKLLSAQLVDEEEIGEGQRTMIDAAAEMLIELLGEQVEKLKNKPIDENDATMEKKTPKPDPKQQPEMDDNGSDGMDGKADPAAEGDAADDGGDMGNAAGENSNPFAAKKKKNPFASSKATTLISLFESEIHMHFTNLADSLRRDGHLTRQERIAFSSAIGDALAAFVRTAEEKMPEGTLYRSPFDDVGKDTPQAGNAVPMVIDPDTTATKGGDGSGFFGHAGRPGERGGSAPSGSGGNQDDAPKERSGTVQSQRLGKSNEKIAGNVKKIKNLIAEHADSTKQNRKWGHYEAMVSIDQELTSYLERFGIETRSVQTPDDPNRAYRQRVRVVNEEIEQFTDHINAFGDSWEDIQSIGEANKVLDKIIETLNRANSTKSADGWMDEGEDRNDEPAAFNDDEPTGDPEMEDDSAEDAAAGGKEDDAEGDGEDEDEGKGKPSAKALGGPVSEMDGAVKSLGKNRIGGYLMMWGDTQRRDLEGEYFTPKTEEMTVIFDSMKALPVIWHHAQDGVMKATVIGVIDTMKPDEIGMWVEAQIKNGKAYRQYVQPLLKQGMLGWSSGALPGSKKAFGGEIKRWATVEGSLTPTPMDHRQVEVPIDEIKGYFLDAGLEWDDEMFSQ